MNLPGISCYCSTYGRPKILIENSIQCFLEQDWAGPKELVILNDFDKQELIFNHPEVKIINTKERIKPLGKKFNENISLCKYDLLATWEDDDIFLRNRLTYSYNNMRDDIFHTHDAFFEKDKFVLSGMYPEGNVYSTGIGTVSGYMVQSGDDYFFKKLEKQFNMKHITVFDSLVYHIQEGEKDE